MCCIKDVESILAWNPSDVRKQLPTSTRQDIHIIKINVDGKISRSSSDSQQEEHPQSY